jgi:hypothetical protein
MNLLLAFTIVLSTQFALAQTEPKVKQDEPASPTGTIVKPTKSQLKTIPKVPPKSKAIDKSEIKTEDETKVESVTETKTEQVTENKPAEVSNYYSSNPHLFGFHVDANVPHFVNYGLDYWHSSRWFSVSANLGGGSVPSSTLKTFIKDVDEPSLKISNQEAVARLHPFMGAFYLGMTFGRHVIEATGNKTVSVTVPAPGSATFRLTDKITSNYLTPHVGWMWKYDIGLTLGFDIGYMAQSGASVDLKEEPMGPLPFGTSMSDYQSTPEYQQARKDVVDASEQIGKKGIPYLALFRIGYMF